MCVTEQSGKLVMRVSSYSVAVSVDFQSATAMDCSIFAQFYLQFGTIESHAN